MTHQAGSLPIIPLLYLGKQRGFLASSRLISDRKYSRKPTHLVSVERKDYIIDKYPKLPFLENEWGSSAGSDLGLTASALQLALVPPSKLRELGLLLSLTYDVPQRVVGFSYRSCCAPEARPLHSSSQLRVVLAKEDESKAFGRGSVVA